MNDFCVSVAICWTQVWGPNIIYARSDDVCVSTADWKRSQFTKQLDLIKICISAFDVIYFQFCT